MVADRKRKPDQLDDAIDVASTACDEGDRAAAEARPGPALNRWSGRRYSKRYYDLLEKRRTLPVWQYKEQFLNLLRRNKVVILVGDGGKGKTTQVPQFALESVFTSGMVACTQPWKVSTISASRRVAEEMDVNLGDEVGYCVPFEERCNEKTILKYLTDVMLLREAAADPQLKKYGIVVIDEAHERTLSTDMLLGTLKGAINKRTDLRIVILGAPGIIEENKLKCFFNNAPILRLPGCQLQPLQVHYLPDPASFYLDLAISTAVQAHTDQPAGDILVFLPREQQVDYVCWQIGQKLQEMEGGARPYIVVPLYANVPLKSLHMVFEPAPIIWNVEGLSVRKIIIATKVAETSVILDGIVYVIDTGFSSRVIDNPDTGVQTVEVSRISKVSADRRAYLARRVQPGVCFRLYTESCFHEELSDNTYSESLGLDLTRTILTMKKIGISDLHNLGYVDSLLPEVITRAISDLRFLGAVTPEGNVTSLGEMMSEFYLDPQMSAMLLASTRYMCSNEIVSIAAMLLVPDCFLWPADGQEASKNLRAQFWHVDGDHLTLLNVYNAYVESNQDAQWCGRNFINAEVMNQAVRIREHLRKIMRGLNLRMCSPDSNSQQYYNNIKLAMLSGYFAQVAYREQPGQGQPGRYVTLRDNKVLQIDQAALLNRKPEFLMYIDLHTSIMRSVTDVPAAMLLHVARDYYNLRNIPRCRFKTTLEMVFLNYLGNSGTQYDYLYDLPQAQLQRHLEVIQWEKVVPVEQAPEAPAPDEQGAGFLPPQ